jgi:hypothetical protein
MAYAPEGKSTSCHYSNRDSHRTILRSNCVCDPGWRGAACSALNITTTDFNNGYNDLAAGTTSWGGRAMVDDAGVWHLFYAVRWLGMCSVASYLPIVNCSAW